MGRCGVTPVGGPTQPAVSALAEVIFGMDMVCVLLPNYQKIVADVVV